MACSVSEYKLGDQILKSIEEANEEVFPVQAKSNIKMMPLLLMTVPSVPLLESPSDMHFPLLENVSEA